MRKLVAFGLTVLLLLSSAAAAAWPSWAAEAQNWAVEQGISDTFLSAPSMKLTRGQTVQLLYEAAGSPAVSGEMLFTDVSGVYKNAVIWAAAQGYVQGTGDGKFRPSAFVTRQEFAAMLYRQAGQPDVSGQELHYFSDWSEIAQWAQDAMLWCVQQELLQGKANDRLAPTETITTAEAVVVLQRAQDDGTPSDNTVHLSGDTDAAAEQMSKHLQSAIAAVQQPPAFDVSDVSASAGWEITAKNVYYALLSEDPSYKYAYDMSVTQQGNILQCTFSYMPYRSGNYPQGFQGVEVDGLHALVTLAQNNLTQTSVNIRITDPSLTVDDMNNALQQVGGGYLLCQLNRDGTAITITTENNMTREACLARLEEIDRMADEMLAECIRDGMTQREKVVAIYTVITDRVKYDRRYYTDISSMPHDSQTAYGALHDNLAICGGYSQAIQVLFEKAGIPCLTVQGQMRSENHMWNIAQIDGEWAYYDATSDRGMSKFGFVHFGVSEDEMQEYVWDAEYVQRLTDSW